MNLHLFCRIAFIKVQCETMWSKQMGLKWEAIVSKPRKCWLSAVVAGFRLKLHGVPWSIAQAWFWALLDNNMPCGSMPQWSLSGVSNNSSFMLLIKCCTCFYCRRDPAWWLGGRVLDLCYNRGFRTQTWKTTLHDEAKSGFNNEDKTRSNSKQSYK